MYPEAISEPLWELLGDLNTVPGIRSAYLGGGTALALQLGHRTSDDLDFFVNEAFSEPSFLPALQERGLHANVLNRTSRHTEFMVRSVKIDVVREQVALKCPLLQVRQDLTGIRMADAMDIGRMKLVAIGTRGGKKDFIDVYCLTRERMTLESLIETAMEENRGVSYSKVLFLKGLVDFEEADSEPDPRLLWNITWQEVRKSLASEIREIARRII